MLEDAVSPRRPMRLLVGTYFATDRFNSAARTVHCASIQGGQVLIEMVMRTHRVPESFIFLTREMSRFIYIIIIIIFNEELKPSLFIVFGWLRHQANMCC